jgi:hypothetical protein
MPHHALFKQSLQDSASYPKNLLFPGALEHTLNFGKRRLDEEAERLFKPEYDAKVNFWEVSETGYGAGFFANVLCHLLSELQNSSTPWFAIWRS